MYTYKVKLNNVIGESLNSIPSALTYKANNKIGERAVFEKAKNYISRKYGVVLESADVNLLPENFDDDYQENRWAHRNTYPKYGYDQKDSFGNGYSKEEIDALNAWNSFINFIQDEAHTEVDFDLGMEQGPDGAEGIIEALDDIIRRANKVKKLTLKAYGKYL